MPNILIRNVDEVRIAALDEQARQSGVSRQEYLLALIEQVAGSFDPAICLGYIKIDRYGDLEPGAIACPECGQDIENFWLRVMGDMKMTAVCEGCAE